MQRELLLLDEIVQAARRATDIADRHSVDGLRANLDARDALLWNMTVIGEAVSQLDDELRERFAAVPWTQPVRLRNRIVHGYWSVDLDLIHSVATGDLPTFTVQVQDVLQQLEAE